MPAAHICPICGTDLALIAPVRDPHYGLLLVFCPTCGRAASRRKHPAKSAWRQTLRVGASLILLGAKLGLGIIVLTASAGLSDSAATELMANGLDPISLVREAFGQQPLTGTLSLADRWHRAAGEEPVLTLIGFGCLIGALGLWMRLALLNERPWRPLAAWATTLIGMVCLWTLGTYASGTWPVSPLAWANVGLFVLGISGAAMLVRPLGAMTVKGINYGRRARWIRGLARARRRRRPS